ncbi:MAG TPA: Trk family potassium uptake protein [Candidatus Rokubacteria bacterium]|nr:Trk family potassium uptake protein [Candidatus Rokubacteria bacterium]
MRLRLTPGLLLAAIALVEYLAPWRAAGRTLTFGLAAFLTARFVAQSVRNLRAAARVRGVLRARVLELALTLAALVLLASKAVVWARLLGPAPPPTLDHVYRQYAAAFLVVAGLRVVAGEFPVRRILHRLELMPAQTVAVGFLGTILAGTLLLSLPLAVERLEELSLLDALFIATSAVTTTGLVVYDPGGFHTRFGELVLVALMQLGGLGTMAVSASLVVLAGRRLRLTRAAALRESLDLDTLGQVRGQVKTIVAVTFAAEALGALALWLRWRERADIEAPILAAVFHAVSAFCTAGFSLLADGLARFRADGASNAIVVALMLLGSLGFPVFQDLGRVARSLAARQRPPRLALHTRLALVTTGVLVAAGLVAALGLEWRGVLAPLTLPGHLLAAVFLAVTAQSTTGFNTVDTGALGPATLWLVMVLMFVGGSPGSTAGGVKTTTLATVVASVWATLRGRARVEAFRRTLSDEQVTKALALIGISLATVAVAILALLATQTGDALALTFEAVSAFGTVGLSTGLTPTLDAWGKLVLVAVMFVGRVGPITLGFALAARARPTRVVYPSEKIMIG